MFFDVFTGMECKVIREALQIKIADVANTLGASRQQVYNFENEKRYSKIFQFAISALYKELATERGRYDLLDHEKLKCYINEEQKLSIQYDNFMRSIKGE